MTERLTLPVAKTGVECYDDTYTLNISANKGSISASEITIVADSLVSNNSAMGLSFGLISVSSSPTTSYAYNGVSYDPTTISGVYTAPNYNFSISDNALIIEKDEDYLDDSITITSSVESKVRSRIQLSDLPDEELIIFLTVVMMVTAQEQELSAHPMM